MRWLGHVERMSEERVAKRLYQNTAEGSRSVGRPRLSLDGRREGGPEEDGCHRLEDTCTQKGRLEDGREGGQGSARTVEPWSSSSSSSSSSSCIQCGSRREHTVDIAPGGTELEPQVKTGSWPGCLHL